MALLFKLPPRPTFALYSAFRKQKQTTPPKFTRNCVTCMKESAWVIGPRGNGVGKFGEGRTDVHDEGGMRKAFMALNCLLECVNIVVRDPSDIRAQFCLHRTCVFFLLFALPWNETTFERAVARGNQALNTGVMEWLRTRAVTFIEEGIQKLPPRRDKYPINCPACARVFCISNLVWWLSLIFTHGAGAHKYLLIIPSVAYPSLLHFERVLVFLSRKNAVIVSYNLPDVSAEFRLDHFASSLPPSNVRVLYFVVYLSLFLPFLIVVYSNLFVLSTPPRWTLPAANCMEQGRTGSLSNCSCSVFFFPVPAPFTVSKSWIDW